MRLAKLRFREDELLLPFGHQCTAFSSKPVSVPANVRSNPSSLEPFSTVLRAGFDWVGTAVKES
jgi:hypothetical protein